MGITVQYAMANGARHEAFPGGRGECPACSCGVISKCGDINTWHWSHTSNADCDSFSEGESHWHAAWKRRFPEAWREVVIGPHRADICSPRGVIELQASPISADEVLERESFYGPMVWVIDATDFFRNLLIRNRGSYVTFRWKHPRKTWWYSRRQIYFDLCGASLLAVHRIHHNMPCGGSGKFISHEAFVRMFTKSTFTSARFREAVAQ